MKLFLKQKLFSFAGEFTIKDEFENVRYTARAQLFSWGRKYRVYDLLDQEVIYVEQKLFSFLPTYFIYLHGEEVATIKKEFTFFRPKYKLYAQGWNVDGDWIEHNYVITHNQQTIATIDKEWFTWSDTYTLDINDEQHELMCLAIAIAIDCVLDSNNAATASATN